MRLLGVPISEVTQNHLKRLRDNEVSEGRELDYKLELPSDKNSKADFLEDIAAFANSSGGILLYGIQEKKDGHGKNTGTIEKLQGVGETNLDDLRLELANLCRDGIRPPIIPEVEEIEVADADGPVIAVGVRGSFIGPHEVTFSRRNGFFHRSTAGNAPMDIAELRRAFGESGSWLQEANQFREDRMRRLKDHWTTLGLDTERLVLLHVLPLGRLDETLDPVPHKSELFQALQGITGCINPKQDFEGLAFHRSHHPTSDGYVKWLRCGGVEVAAGWFFAQNSADESEFFMDGDDLRTFLTRGAPLSAKAMNDILGRDPPFAVLLTFLNAHRTWLFQKGWGGRPSPESMSDPDMAFPPFVLEGIEEDAEESLKPLLDHVWQTFGFESS